MRRDGRYSECVMHPGDEAAAFIADYFVGRRVLMVAGAGFDPRACIAPQELANAGAHMSLRLIRERRPSPTQELAEAAEANLEVLASAVPDLDVIDIDVFDKDGAVVGGRRVATAVDAIANSTGYSDIVVDMSALSIGTSFPAVRLLVEHLSATRDRTNLHVTVAHDPNTDLQIQRTAGDRPGWVHGFGGTLGVDHEHSPAKLWMPQLAFGVNQELSRIYEFVGPDDTCPILPFPARDPKLADRLAVEYREELLGAWDVDVRNIVYADEDDPLDVYRTILRIDDLRRPVFEGSGGSAIILTPAGSKLTALGALMACVERDLPVAYLEAESYDMSDVDDPSFEPRLVHLWLEGEAYPEDRPALMREV